MKLKPACVLGHQVRKQIRCSLTTPGPARAYDEDISIRSTGSSNIQSLYSIKKTINTECKKY